MNRHQPPASGFGGSPPGAWRHRQAASQPASEDAAPAGTAAAASGRRLPRAAGLVRRPRARRVPCPAPQPWFPPPVGQRGGRAIRHPGATDRSGRTAAAHPDAAFATPGLAGGPGPARQRAAGRAEPRPSSAKAGACDPTAASAAPWRR